MQNPKEPSQNQFYGMLNEPLPPTPTSRQATILAPQSPLRYATKPNSPHLSSMAPPASSNKTTNGQPSIFSMPSPTYNINNHQQEQIVGPSDHYGIHQASFNSLNSPNHTNRKNYNNNINSNNTIEAATLKADILGAKPAQSKATDETKVCVIVDSRTPVIIKIPVSPANITLADLKLALPAIDQPNYKYFFKSNDSEFGIVKEEIQEDDSHLPTYRNRVVAWIVTPKRGDDELASRFRSETSDTCNMTYSNTSYDEGTSSILTTDLESTSYFTETDDDSNSCSNYSETTCDTFISQRRSNRHRTNGRSPSQGNMRGSPYRNTGQHHNVNIANISSPSTSSSSSSSSTQSSNPYSDATAVHCVTVHLVLTQENFLGLHIYANAVNGVDEGIYVDDVTENSAVALDGRIEPGDKLIQVNDRNLEELTNEEAVKVLKEAVIRRGPLKLVVAKFVENNKNDPIAGLKEAIHPINTAAWVAHAQAMTIPSNQQQKQSNSATSSPSFGSIAQDTDCIEPALCSASRLGMSLGLRLSKDTNDLKDIVMHMKMPTVGLDIKDRQWLKINIPSAFLGADLMKWLERNVQGFVNEYDARKFAIRMLEEGIIQDPLSANQFSPKSFYTFVL